MNSTLDQRISRRHPRRAEGATLKGSAFRWVALLGCVLGSAVLTPTHAAAPPAGSVIGNQASATYTDASNTPRTATSNVALTTVQQVAALDLTDDGSRRASPGGQVIFPHTVVNNGNGTDTFTLAGVDNAGGLVFSSVALYPDANGDGIPDNSTPLTATPPLAPGDSYQFVLVATVPGSAANGTYNNALTVTATSQFTGTVTDSNNDSVVVTANAVLVVSKALNVASGPPGTTPLTYTLLYQNTGNSTATNVILTDVIPSGMTYIAGTARWSVTGAGVTLTDASSSDGQGTYPESVIYDYNVTAAGQVTAKINRIAAGQSGTLTFQVSVNSGLAPQFIDNRASFTYYDGSADVGPFYSNIARYEVTSTVDVTWVSGTTVPSATQGATVSFNNVVRNDGNGVDTFDISIGTHNFPSGTTFALYQSDGVTPMVDSNGNSTPDTGPLNTNQTYTVVLKATLPGSATGGPFTVQKIARSTVDPTVSDTVTDTLTAITSSSVDLENGGTLDSAANGHGAGPEAAAITTNSTNPGTTTRFTLKVQNTSSVSDTYDLVASTNSTITPIALPTGWSVVFRNAGMSVITATGIVPAGGVVTVYADVTIPVGEAPGTWPIYFRAMSPTSGAKDTKYDAVTVNRIRRLGLTSDNTGQVFPGGSVVYTHVLSNNGNVLEGDGAFSTIALATTHSLSGWSSVVYYDSNGNGALDAADAVVTNAAFVSAAAAGLAPGESVRLFVKVFAPGSAAVGAIDAATLTATTSNGSYTDTVPSVVQNTDATTVVSGDLTIVKEQALDADGDGAADGAYGATPLSATPGQYLRYRITVTNSGTAPATNIVLSDSTPTFTKYHDLVAAAATAPGSVTAVPADGAAGTIQVTIATLNPGESVVITFGVRIDPL